MFINYDFIQKHLGLQGIKVTYTNVNNGIFEIYAVSIHDCAICPRCKKAAHKVHDSRCQTYKHLTIWGMQTVIILTKRRYICDCDLEHPFDEPFTFIRKYQRQTIPYEKYAFTLMHKNTIKNAADILDDSEHTCQRIYNHYANMILDNASPKPLKLLGIDDIARRKGHNYNTVIYNLETREVVSMIIGRKKEDVITHIKTWSEEIRAGIQAVSMDMSRTYCHSILECFPNAKPVIDRFHISQHLHRCVDEARKHIQNHIKKYDKKDEVFKIRWALLKNVEDITHEEALQLILSCNKYPQIEQLHYFKEEFRDFFFIESKESAAAFIAYYNDLVAEADISELKTFCKTLDNWLPYILNYYDYPISNGPTEGNNHKIKNIKRRAYGYRNTANFELRVKLESKCV